MAYDFTASSAIVDSVFGEYTIEPSETEFYIRTGPNWSVYATNKLTYAIVIYGYNVVYPFTVSYDASLLYSDSLPGTPSDVVPKVWARLDGTGLIEGCPNIDFDGFTVVLVDTVIEGYPSSAIDDPHCLRDSLVIVEGLISISVGLMEWNPPTPIPSISNQYDNPIKVWLDENSLMVQYQSAFASELQLFNISGILLHEVALPSGTFALSEQLNSRLQETHGLVLVHVTNAKGVYVQKLIKQLI